MYIYIYIYIYIRDAAAGRALPAARLQDQPRLAARVQQVHGADLGGYISCMYHDDDNNNINNSINMCYYYYYYYHNNDDNPNNNNNNHDNDNDNNIDNNDNNSSNHKHDNNNSIKSIGNNTLIVLLITITSVMGGTTVAQRADPHRANPQEGSTQPSLPGRGGLPRPLRIRACSGRNPQSLPTLTLRIGLPTG